MLDEAGERADNQNPNHLGMESVFVNVVIPVHNEERTLAQTVYKVRAFLETDCPHDYEIVIANNASTDRTLEIGHQLQAQYPSVNVVHLDERGRGGALKRAWSQSRADILSYMDVDLSSDLTAFPQLIDSLIHGPYDVAMGSRLLNPSWTTRSLQREIISRGYNLLVKALFQTHFSDAQCGFKAITRKAAGELLPFVEDNAWFMDTELLVIAEKLGYRIFDFPVRWVEDVDSRVKIWSTAVQDIKGLLRVRRNLASGRYARVDRSKHQQTLELA